MTELFWETQYLAAIHDNMPAEALVAHIDVGLYLDCAKTTDHLIHTVLPRLGRAGHCEMSVCTRHCEMMWMRRRSVSSHSCPILGDGFPMTLPYALLADKQEDDCVDVRVMFTHKLHYNGARAPPEHAESFTPSRDFSQCACLRCRQRGYRYSPYLHPTCTLIPFKTGSELARHRPLG
jgi:hypothetical protein